MEFIEQYKVQIIVGIVILLLIIIYNTMQRTVWAIGKQESAKKYGCGEM